MKTYQCNKKYSTFLNGGVTNVRYVRAHSPEHAAMNYAIWKNITERNEKPGKMVVVVRDGSEIKVFETHYGCYFVRPYAGEK